MMLVKKPDSEEAINLETATKFQNAMNGMYATFPNDVLCYIDGLTLETLEGYMTLANKLENPFIIIHHPWDQVN